MWTGLDVVVAARIPHRHVEAASESKSRKN